MDARRIPIVDLDGLNEPGFDRSELAAQLREICHDIGFFVIVNHGLRPALLGDVFAMMRRFFDLPTGQKAVIDKRRSRHFRGWEAVGTEFTNNRPDIREQVDLWSERTALAHDVEPAYLRLLGPNQWMPDDVMPGQRALIDEWCEALGALADELLGLLSLALGLDETHLADAFGEQSMSLTKLISYPATPDGAAGVNAHHDTGFITLLAAGTTPGLQVLDPQAGWIDVPIVADSFVVNLGEMLQALTGNYFVATAHRVITAEPRLSAAYFHGPSLDMPLEPLDLSPDYRRAVEASSRHASAGFMATREQTESGVGDMASATRADTYGDQLWNYFARSYPDNMAEHYS